MLRQFGFSAPRQGSSPVRDSETHAGPQPCHPVSHLGSFIGIAGRKQPWGKGDFAVTTPRITKLAAAGPCQGRSPSAQAQIQASPRRGHSWAALFSQDLWGWWHLEAGHGFGLFRFNESLVVKYPQQRADHKNQREGYLP